MSCGGRVHHGCHVLHLNGQMPTLPSTDISDECVHTCLQSSVHLFLISSINIPVSHACSELQHGLCALPTRFWQYLAWPHKLNESIG